MTSDLTRINGNKLKGEVPAKNEQKFLYCEGDRPLEYKQTTVPHNSCGESFYGDTQNSPECNTVRCALGDHDCQGGW